MSKQMSPRTLVESQEEFYRLLITVNDQLDIPTALFDSSVVGEAGLRRRLEIYRSNIRASLVKALRQTYPVCERLVGTDYFRQLARDYSLRTPSYQQDLNCYGHSFAEYLDQIVKDRIEAQVLGYLPDVARLEWLIHLSSRAEDARPFDFDTFAKFNSEETLELVFLLAPAVFLFQSVYPVYTIWLAHQESVDIPTIELAQGGEQIVIYRVRVRTELQLVNDYIWNLLRHLSQGRTLNEFLAEVNSEQTWGNFNHSIMTLIEQGIVSDYSSRYPAPDKLKKLN